MDASKSSPLSSLKSKKPLRSPAPSDQKTRTVSDPDSNPWSVKTPGKPADPSRRSRQTRAALSIKEIREAALKLRERGSKPRDRTNPILGSEEEQIANMEQKSVDSEIKLPEKYELLNEFFQNLDSSIRLLRLKRYPTTFSNIRPRIESLTERRFTYSHLAQLKFIMPEAILLEVVRQRDEQTGVVKPDLLITLSFEVIESKSKSNFHCRNLQLRTIFHDKLLHFFKSHPEGGEVPEEALPEPFFRLKGDLGAKSGLSASSFVTLSGQPDATSHLPRSFRTSSQQVSGHALEDKFAGNPSGKETSANAAKSHSELPLKPSGGEECSSYQGSSSHSITSSPLPETPLKCTIPIKDDNQSPLLRTPAGLASTPAKLMSATPMLQPPQRCYMSPDDNSSRSPSKLLRRPPPNRPLKFDTPVKSVRVDDDFGRTGNASVDDVLDILPEALVQSIREKERLASIEQDPAISQAKWRRQMISKLPKLFDLIYFLFQSIRRSVVTKEELIHKIILGHLDIVDRREVEEQLRLLQELAPEWIYEKSAISGDLLMCVNKISSPDAIRTRLSEAK